MKPTWLIVALVLFLLWRNQGVQATPVAAGAGNQSPAPPVASPAPVLDESETEENDAPTSVLPVPSGSSPVAVPIISQSPFRTTLNRFGLHPTGDLPA